MKSKEPLDSKESLKERKKKKAKVEALDPSTLFSKYWTSQKAKQTPIPFDGRPEEEGQQQEQQT
jgi:hypothetical protein